MTREKAIDLLDNLIGMIGDSCISDYDTALQMGIEALEQEPILDKIKTEMEQIEINGHIRDVECFRAGINVALNIINKYKVESEDTK